MFDLLARLVTRWPRLILLASVAGIGLAVLAGLGVQERLKPGGYTDPGSESAIAKAALDERFSTSRPNIVLLVTAPGGVDEPAAAAEGGRLADRLAAEPDMEGVTSYWQTDSADLRSRDGTSALVVGRLRGDPAGLEARATAIDAAYRGDHGSVQVRVGGAAAVNAAIETMVREDIQRAELIGIPIIVVILTIVLHGFIASFLPLVVGIVGVIGTYASLRFIAEFTDVSIFAPNLAVGLGLGLAVDYALFIVRRHREELRRGADVPTAIRITLNTAGRTVAFSALTVVVSMSAMLIFPMYFLRSFAYAGISVVILAAIAALVPLSAALVVTGHRLDAGDVTRPIARAFGRKPRVGDLEPGSRGWRRLAETVTRRPLAFTVAITLLLLALGSQVLGIKIGMPDDRSLPASAESQQVQQELRVNYAARPAAAVDVLVDGVDPAARQGELAEYARQISVLPNVARVTSSAGIYSAGREIAPANPQLARFATADSAYLSVTTDAEEISEQGKSLVGDIRALAAPFPVLIGGASAELVDTQDKMLDLFPLAIGLIAASTLLLLFLFTGSVLVPVKAVVMNTLSLSATFGVVVWIFQEGHLAGLLGFQVTGWVMVQLLVLLFCVAFGVSMDYEVFLLSRIKEEYARTGDNHRAVVFGVERTGGVVTAASLITAVVFMAMASSRVTHIMMFGIGLALALLLDAFIVRTMLVPAVMRLAGRANWWAPRPLRRLHDRFGLKETDRAYPAPVDLDRDAGGEYVRADPVRSGR